MSGTERDREGAQRGARRRTSPRDLLSVGAVVGAVAVGVAALVGPATSNFRSVLRPAETVGSQPDAADGTDDGSVAFEIRNALRSPINLLPSPAGAPLAVIGLPARVPVRATPVAAAPGSVVATATAELAAVPAPLTVVPVELALPMGAAPLVDDTVTDASSATKGNASHKAKAAKVSRLKSSRPLATTEPTVSALGTVERRASKDDAPKANKANKADKDDGERDSCDDSKHDHRAERGKQR